MKTTKRPRGDVPNHRANTAALRRFERRQRRIDNPVDVPEAINARQLEAKSGRRFHPTKGWRRDRFYKIGDPSRPTQMEMVATFFDTIRKAQGRAGK